MLDVLAQASGQLFFGIAMLAVIVIGVNAFQYTQRKRGRYRYHARLCACPMPRRPHARYCPACGKAYA